MPAPLPTELFAEGTDRRMIMCAATLCANLLLQAGRAEVLRSWSRSRSFRRLDTEINSHLLSSQRAASIYQQAPVTPVPAEVRIRNDILTSVPESLIESVLTCNITNMMTSLSKAKLERFINKVNRIASLSNYKNSNYNEGHTKYTGTTLLPSREMF